MKQLKSHVRHEDPEIMSISHIHVLLLSPAISLIVSLTLPSWSPVLVLKLPNDFLESPPRMPITAYWSFSSTVLWTGIWEGGFGRLNETLTLIEDTAKMRLLLPVQEKVLNWIDPCIVACEPRRICRLVSNPSGLAGYMYCILVPRLFSLPHLLGGGVGKRAWGRGCMY